VYRSVLTPVRRRRRRRWPRVLAACAIAAGLTLRVLGATLSRQGGAFGRVDRGLGALVGGAKAALVLWVMLSVLALWGRAVHLGPVHLDPRGSDLVAFAREHNALRRSSDPSPSPR
jgi:membrane protein required for colicin V production